MATNKVKRSIHLAQPHTQDNGSKHPSAGPGPVKSHVYHSIAELNTGLEKAIHNLQMLQRHHLFSAGLAEMNHVLQGIRARANLCLTTVLSEREAANVKLLPTVPS